MNEIKWREVPFNIMLKSDGAIKCECWLLSNSVNKFGTDLREPMLFNEFLRQIGTYLTALNCSSLFEQAKWYVIDDEVHPMVQNGQTIYGATIKRTDLIVPATKGEKIQKLNMS